MLQILFKICGDLLYQTFSKCSFEGFARVTIRYCLPDYEFSDDVRAVISLVPARQSARSPHVSPELLLGTRTPVPSTLVIHLLYWGHYLTLHSGLYFLVKSTLALLDLKKIPKISTIRRKMWLRRIWLPSLSREIWVILIIPCDIKCSEFASWSTPPIIYLLHGVHCQLFICFTEHTANYLRAELRGQEACVVTPYW